MPSPSESHTPYWSGVDTIEKANRKFVGQIIQEYIRKVERGFAQTDPDLYRKLMFAPAQSSIPANMNEIDGIALAACLMQAVSSTIIVLDIVRTSYELEAQEFQEVKAARRSSKQ